MINIIYCEYCNWKTLTKDFSDVNLKEIPSDDKNKKFKCPKCGRLISSKKIQDPQNELEKKIHKEKQSEDLKKWMEETLSYREEFNKNE